MVQLPARVLQLPARQLTTLTSNMYDRVSETCTGEELTMMAIFTYMI